MSDVVYNCVVSFQSVSRHKWPIRDARPIKEKLSGKQAMLTCQRVIDALFPVTLGGTSLQRDLENFRILPACE